MIKVDNSYKKRIFIDSKADDVLKLKELVEQDILEIESDGSFEYKKLGAYENKVDAKHLSIYKFKKEIDKEINKLLSNSKIPKYFKKELSDIQKNIYLILIGRFDKVKEYIEDLVNKNSVLTYRSCDEKKLKHYKKYKESFENLYSIHLSKKEKLKKSFFTMFDDINVCPYCNRNFISPIYKEEKIGNDNAKQSPDIEHFYPKSMYPLLSLSISNLLPSCSFCNKIKSDVDTYENCKSPYEIEDNDLKFKFEPIDAKKRRVILETSLNNSKILHLEHLYANVHIQYINDIYFDILSHPDANLNFLSKMLGTEKYIEEDWYKSFFRNYYNENDFNRHPLAKMTKDLYGHLKEMTKK